MGLLLLKLTLAPALVALATQVAKRLGHRAGGLVGGLPVVAAPVVLIFALDHGKDYAAEAASATALGVVSLIGFCVAYGLAAPRTPWPIAVAAGWGAFLGATALFAQTDLPVGAALALVALGIVLATRLHQRLAHGAEAPGARTALWLRLLITAVLVVALTQAAGDLDPHLSGLLAPFPIITAVLAGFTHAQAGGEAANELLAGLVPGLVSFALFFAVLAPTLEQTSTAAGFAIATAVTLAAHTALILVYGKRGARPA